MGEHQVSAGDFAALRPKIRFGSCGNPAWVLHHLSPDESLNHSLITPCRNPGSYSSITYSRWFSSKLKVLPLFLPWKRETTPSMPRPPTSPSPPPASFPYTIGSFDFPHASTSPSSSHHTGSATTSRNALLSLADRALEQTSFTEHDALTMPRHTARRTRVASRGPLHRVFGPPRDSDVTDHLSRRPPTANPNRPRATPSERYLRRSQTRRRRQPSAENDPATRLLESLSGLPTNNPFTLPDSNARARSPVVQVNSERRNKRRKLDHDTDGTPEYTCYKYGHKGQVVPGRLRMEVVSCDGGEHRKDNSPGQYRVQNVLRNDKSVYCSESSQCNLLLKHMGEASFALEKIVIRAPDRGFTAPYVSSSNVGSLAS